MFVWFTIITSRYGNFHKVGVGMTYNIDTSVLLQSKPVVRFFHFQMSHFLLNGFNNTVVFISYLQDGFNLLLEISPKFHLLQDVVRKVLPVSTDFQADLQQLLIQQTCWVNFVSHVH